MRISDWSSDVCSSDLIGTIILPASLQQSGSGVVPFGDDAVSLSSCRDSVYSEAIPDLENAAAREGRSGSPPCSTRLAVRSDRKSVVSGTSVSVRLDLGGRGSIKKKTKQNTNTN